MPMMFIDVNIGHDKGTKRLIIFENDDPVELAEKFARNHLLTD
jgi:hypothetical protein